MGKNGRGLRSELLAQRSNVTRQILNVEYVVKKRAKPTAAPPSSARTASAAGTLAEQVAPEFLGAAGNGVLQALESRERPDEVKERARRLELRCEGSWFHCRAPGGGGQRRAGPRASTR